MVVKSGIASIAFVLIACSTAVDDTATSDGHLETGASAAERTAGGATRTKACMPDTTVTWEGCETGCCHDILWEIASNCFQPAPATPWQVPDGCEGKLPAPATLCAGVRNQDSSRWMVVFNDTKVNKCPTKLVHTLAIPRERVCGTDDPDRLELASDGFAMAWRVGKKLIPEQEQIALVVNSLEQRSQNQLHIHSVRLKSDARAAIESLPVKPRHVDDLAAAWTALGQHAEESGYRDNHGAIVISDTATTGWLVAATDGSSSIDPITKEDMNAPEQKYTCWACDTCP